MPWAECLDPGWGRGFAVQGGGRYFRFMPKHASPTERRPNVIWVFGDQHRGQALGCMGDPNLHTPNIDRLAAEGVHFTNAVMGFPLCCPARGSLVTGQYPHRCVPGHQHQMPPSATTLAHAFNDAGYDTAWFGKWHLDGGQEGVDGRMAFHDVPRDRRGGFNTWIGYENNNAQFDCYVHGHRGGQEVARYRLPTFETDALTDLLLDYLTDQKPGGMPFFASLSVQPPHDPYTAPAQWMGRHTPGRIVFRENVPNIPRIREQAARELAGYYALIENLDWNLGRIREALWERGLSDDTYIVFFSDHGDHHGSHGHFRKMTPYEESIRVPFIIGGPKDRHYSLEHRQDAVVNHVDVAPTTLGLCGIPAPDTMQGYDYSNRLHKRNKADDEPDSAYLQCVIPTGHGPSIDLPWRGVVTRDGWKYVALEGQPFMMFNLKEDPYEQVNLAHHAHARHHRARLNALTAQWIEKTGDSFELPQFNTH